MAQSLMSTNQIGDNRYRKVGEHTWHCRLKTKNGFSMIKEGWSWKVKDKREHVVWKRKCKLTTNILTLLCKGDILYQQ